MHASKVRTICLRHRHAIPSAERPWQGFLGRWESAEPSNIRVSPAYHVCFAAVNTYFRAVLAEQVRRADFEPKEYAQLANCQTPAPTNLTQGSGSREQSSFDSIPAPVLEHVLKHCNLLTVCNAASACRSLHQVSLPCLLCCVRGSLA